MAASNIALARRRLAETRIKLREHAAYLAWLRARAEQRVLYSVGGDPKKLGANDEERKRAMTLALADDAEYQEALQKSRQLEADADRQEADLESAKDERRKWEWSIRERLAAALDGRGIAPENVERQDHEFDEAATEAATVAVQTDISHPFEPDPLPAPAPEEPPADDEWFDAIEDGQIEPETLADPLDIQPCEPTEPETNLAEQFSKIADYQKCIFECETLPQLASVSIDIEIDSALTEADRATLNRAYNARKEELQRRELEAAKR
jgi:hypothetical protein